MRYEIIEQGLEIDLDSKLDLMELATIELLEGFEQQNHRVVDKLVAKGYKYARDACRFVNRVTAEQVQSRKALQTRPNTRERQDALAKARYSGDHFYIDGGVMNSADLLIGNERKQMLEKAKEVQKVKKRYIKAAAVEREYKELIAAKKKKWTAPNYITAIKRHHGVDIAPKGKTSLEAKDANTVKRIFQSKYKNRKPPPHKVWTPSMEAKLVRLEKGEINSVQETAIYGKAAKMNEDYIVVRLKNVSEPTRLHAMRRLYDNLAEDARKRSVDVLIGHNDSLYDSDDSDDSALVIPLQETSKQKNNDFDVVDANSSLIVEDDAQGLDTIVEEVNDLSSSSTSFDSDNLGSDDESECSAQCDAPKAANETLQTRRSSWRRLNNISYTYSSDSSEEEGNFRDQSANSEALEANRIALLKKRDDSSTKEKREKDLEHRNGDLEEGKERLLNETRPSIKHLVALLLSKGIEPPEKAKKAVLERLWKTCENSPDWKRTVYFTEDDKKRLDDIEKKMVTK